MCKRKSKTSSALPLTPLLCINDPQVDTPNINAISAVIPFTTIGGTSANQIGKFYRGSTCRQSVMIIAGTNSDNETERKLALSNEVKAETIKCGANFASINLYLHNATPSSKLQDWGTNHLDLDISHLTPEQTADKVYKWLFTVLSVPEQLHLIAPAEMLATDIKNFAHYAYCPLSESHLRPKDAKIQFVALVTSKPEVMPTKNGQGSKLTWTVADRTGTATFYFLHRGPQSQPTWDWVLSLKLGDRKALPRMPSVAIAEPASKHVAKSPFRLVGHTISGTGKVIASVGHGLGTVGKKMAMGKSKEWVPEADVCYDKKGRPTKKKSMQASDSGNGDELTRTASGVAEKREVKVFDDKGRRLWGDEDSIASTQDGERDDEKL